MQVLWGGENHGEEKKIGEKVLSRMKHQELLIASKCSFGLSCICNISGVFDNR